MVEVELISETDSIIKYRYYPEGKQNFGIISFSKETGLPTLEERAIDDIRGNYSGHVYSLLFKSQKTGHFPVKEMVAWY